MKIIDIANYHQWDGVELSEKALANLLEALKFGRFVYICKYLDDEGVEHIDQWWGGNRL